MARRAQRMFVLRLNPDFQTIGPTTGRRVVGQPTLGLGRGIDTLRPNELTLRGPERGQVLA